MQYIVYLAIISTNDCMFYKMFYKFSLSLATSFHDMVPWYELYGNFYNQNLTHGFLPCQDVKIKSQLKKLGWDDRKCHLRSYQNDKKIPYDTNYNIYWTTPFMVFCVTYYLELCIC